MPLSLVRFYINGAAWVADLTRPAVLARPVAFEGDRETWMGAHPAGSEPMRSGDFVGSVAQGGPVNAAVLTLTPHGNGTHTEGIGHITRRADPVRVPAAPLPASLVTPRGDLVAALDRAESGFLEAVVLRTGAQPLDPDHMRTLLKAGVRHLIVEAPSVDPEDDGGALLAHRAWWGVEPSGTATHSPRTITELAAIPASLADGPYLLNLQVPALETDAVPSRPILYPVVRSR
ncbi:MAG: cyclase family protein [Rhodothermales bacterium]|nr:cyclase family protein [Rhodothermales bacterium]MBO6780570.1 cyclase family protein [Rhodothermales bacterium]